MKLHATTGLPPGQSPELRTRLRVLAALVVAAFLGLVGRLWYLQILRGRQYYDATADNFLKEVDIPAPRGLLLDRNGVHLAENRPAFDVEITPRFFTAEALDRLARLLDLPPEQRDGIRSRARDAERFARYRPVRVLADISRDELALVEQNRADLPGVQIVEVPHRYYPNGALAAHLVGYMNQITAQELADWKDQGYRSGDDVGRFGAERLWEAVLRGRDGRERIVVDAHGRQKPPDSVEGLLDAMPGPRRVDPLPGENVVLTIDARLQRMMERALRGHGAAGAVLVDVHTGQILAMASAPSFDPNELSGHITRAELQALDDNPLHPLLDRAAQVDYFPGSTFKVATALAALADRDVTLDQEIDCTGELQIGNRAFRCDGVHGWVDLEHALAVSCDVYFWSVGEKVGLDRIADMARALGFGAPTGLGLNGEAGGFVPTKTWYEHEPGGFKIGYTLNTAIGQGSVKVTVLQLALAYAALANGGDLYAPQLLLRQESATGQGVEYPSKLRRHLPVPAASLAAVLLGLRGAVNDPKGTAYDARLPDLLVAGKTGTAQVRRLGHAAAPGTAGADHAWFAGFAPAGAPQVAVAVIIEHGGVGGKVAAPVAMSILEGYFDQQRAATQPAARSAAATARGNH